MPMKRNLFVAIIVGAALFSLVQTGAKEVSQSTLHELNAEPGNSCRGKSRCIAVYMTPWCPTCKATVPIVQALMRTPPDSSTGVIAVVGGDTRARIDSIRSMIGESALADYENKFAEALKVRAVPHWFVWDSNGKILRSLAVGPPNDVGSMEEQAKIFTNSVLRIPGDRI